MVNSIGTGIKIGWRSIKEAFQTPAFYMTLGALAFLSYGAMFLAKGLSHRYNALFATPARLLTKTIVGVESLESIDLVSIVLTIVFLVFSLEFLSLVYVRVLINNFHGRKGIDGSDVLRYICLALAAGFIIFFFNVLFANYSLKGGGVALGGSNYVVQFFVSLITAFYVVHVAAERRLFVSFNKLDTTVSQNVLNYVGCSIVFYLVYLVGIVIVGLLGAGIFLSLNLHNAPQAVLELLNSRALVVVVAVLVGIGFLSWMHALTRLYLETNNRKEI